MKRHREMESRRSGFALLVRLLIPALLLSCHAYGQVGSHDWSGATELYPGIKHAEVTVSSPRKMVINAMRMDTTTPYLRFYSSGRSSPWVLGATEVQREKTRDFMRESQATDKKLVVAINADFWNPWYPSEWDQETKVDVGGLAVSEGTLVSKGSDRPSLIFEKNGTISMATTAQTYDSSNVQTAVSGFHFCLTEGAPLTGNDSLHPRTGTGLSQDSRYVYFTTIDGRQPDSGGSTTEELGTWLKYFGSYTGINMDGGGSTTMAWWNPNTADPDKCKLLNNPRGGGGGFTTERCVGNSIGVYYVPRRSGSLLFLILAGVVALTLAVVSLRRKKKSL